jgi:hypothetical protein
VIDYSIRGESSKLIIDHYYGTVGNYETISAAYPAIIYPPPGLLQGLNTDSVHIRDRGRTQHKPNPAQGTSKADSAYFERTPRNSNLPQGTSKGDAAHILSERNINPTSPRALPRLMPSVSRTRRDPPSMTRVMSPCDSTPSSPCTPETMRWRSMVGERTLLIWY